LTRWKYRACYISRPTCIATATSQTTPITPLLPWVPSKRRLAFCTAISSADERTQRGENALDWLPGRITGERPAAGRSATAVSARRMRIPRYQGLDILDALQSPARTSVCGGEKVRLIACCDTTGERPVAERSATVVSTRRMRIPNNVSSASGSHSQRPSNRSGIFSRVGAALHSLA